MPTSIAIQAEPHLPTSYSALAKALDSGHPLNVFQLRGSRAQVYRFANRYKVAHAFQAIELTGYTLPTVRAYGALFRVLITWSVAEQYLKITALPRLDDLIPKEKRQQCLAAIRLADKDGLFFEAVCGRTRDATLVREVQQAVSGTSALLTPLVRAVRHGFAHGDLAPGANGARPGVAQKFANNVCPLLLSAINTDFTRRVSDGLKGLPNIGLQPTAAYEIF